MNTKMNLLQWLSDIEYNGFNHQIILILIYNFIMDFKLHFKVMSNELRFEIVFEIIYSDNDYNVIKEPNVSSFYIL